MNGQSSGPNKSMLYYAAIAMLVVMLLNALVFPSLIQRKLIETTYSDFLDMVEQGKVTEVALEDTQIIFLAKDEKGTEAMYKTGVWPDPSLIERLRVSNVLFSTAIPKQDSPLFNFILTWIVPMIVFAVMWRVVGTMMNKRLGGGAMTFGKSNAKIYVQAQTGKTFEDVAGQDEAKEALMEIVDFLHHPEKYASIGANLPKGALLVGPPGTGKTLLAKAVAGEAKVPFFSISGSEFVEMFVGMGAAKVRDLFKQASEKAPCIIFIDEIDTIGKKRDNGANLGSNDEREQTLNQLLSEMDGFDGKKGVVILAATNRPESLDKALLRPGRFDRRITVELPDVKGREAILLVHAKNVKTDQNVDFTTIARTTPGASGAELANIINEAALRAVRMGRNIISQSDLEESVEVIIAGYQRKNAVLSVSDKKIVAYHEIGHALVSAKQSNAQPVHKITIIPRTSGALGYVLHVDEEEQVLLTKDQVLAKIITATGGRAAEELVFQSITTGAANDIEQATRIARAMISRYGMSKQFGMVALEAVNNPYLGGDTTLMCSNETATKIDAEVIATVGDCYQKAMSILRSNQKKLHELADYLYEQETITGQEFMRLLSV